MLGTSSVCRTVPSVSTTTTERANRPRILVSVRVTPKSVPKLLRKLDAATTSEMPSAPQNLRSAYGRSADAQTTVVFSRPAASSLNRRTDAAQVSVSTLGRMLRITRRPAYASEVMSTRSVPVRVYDGAVLPGRGRSPMVWAGLSPSAVVAMRPVYQVLPPRRRGAEHRPATPRHRAPPTIEPVLTRLAPLAATLLLVPAL